MDRNLLLAGGAVLAVGGLAYWYLSQQNGNGNGVKCEDYNAQTECEAHGCYWYNGTCHSAQPPPHGCIGPCMYEGQTDCDQQGNLCICHNGEWELQQLDSPLCITGEKHYACLPSVNKIVACMPTVGPGVDICTDPYFSYGCFCNPPDMLCDEFHFCDERVHRCVELRALTISADNSTWEQCQTTTNFPWCQCFDCSGQTCDYELGREYAASTLTGTFGWEWSLWGSEFKLRLYGYLEGVGWTLLGEKMLMSWGDTGEETVIFNFARQGISKLRFACCDDIWINSKPKYFYGTLS